MPHALAGQPAPPQYLTDIPALLAAYELAPDPADPAQRVAFGTSGHRGSALDRSFNAAHILAISQAVAEYRHQAGIFGPLFLGKDTHALSSPAQQTALGVLAANDVEVLLQEGDGYTPTPVVSHAILAHNRDATAGRADGIVLTPSHNPPRDGGIKYNPPHGGPADTDATGWIERRANELLAGGNRGVRYLGPAQAWATGRLHAVDLMGPYIDDLGAALDLPAVAASGLRIGVDPMGGAAVAYWERIAQRHRLAIEVVNPRVDPAFAFMPLDHDGKIRMDCSSPHAMAGLLRLKDRFDIAWGNDADVDRHGIVTPSLGLLNPNHYLAVAIEYLLAHRPHWPRDGAIGKTLVSSGLIDRVVAAGGRRLFEVPVGFKWFAPGLLDGSVCFGGEESAGASFLRCDGRTWTTDKDGLLLGLLAAEITAVTGRDPGRHYEALAQRLGSPSYRRIDAAATPAQKAAFRKLTPARVRASELAGEPIVARLTQAPGNGADIGGIKVASANGWFAARPSGTEDIYKLYAESFRGPEHLERIIEEAQAIVTEALAG